MEGGGGRDDDEESSGAGSIARDAPRRPAFLTGCAAEADEGLEGLVDGEEEEEEEADASAVGSSTSPAGHMRREAGMAK